MRTRARSAPGARLEVGSSAPGSVCGFVRQPRLTWTFRVRFGARTRCAAAVRAPYGTPGRAALLGVRYVCTVDKKNALRAGAVAAGTTLMMLLMSSPALALTRDDGDDPGTGLSVIDTIGLFVVAPIALFAVIAGLVMVLDKSRKAPEKA